jgi:outer membrane lipoprotein-sorting protein
MTEVSSSRNPFHRSPGRRPGVRALLPLGVVAVVAAGTALAPSLASASPALPAISAQALLTKLASSKVQAYSGTVNVTTNLGLPALPDLGGGANPMSLLSGTHVLQVAANGPDKQRVALLDDESEYDLIHNGQQLWIYESDQNTVEEGTLPAKQDKSGSKDQGQTPVHPAGSVPMTPAQAVQQVIAAITPTTGLAVAGNQSVAGQAAYTLVVTPKQSGSLVAKVEIAVDAQNGAPLSFAIYSANAPGTPVFQVEFTSVSFSAPADSRFEFTAPAGAKVGPLTGFADQGRKSGGDDKSAEPQTLGQGWLSVLELHGLNVTGDLNQLEQQGQGQQGHQGQKGQGSQSSQSSKDSQNPSGLFNGDIGSYLQALGNAGTKVSGQFGSGTLYTTNFVTVLATDDGRVFIGAVTSSVLRADADAQGSR